MLTTTSVLHMHMHVRVHMKTHRYIQSQVHMHISYAHTHTDWMAQVQMGVILIKIAIATSEFAVLVFSSYSLCFLLWLHLDQIQPIPRTPNPPKLHLYLLVFFLKEVVYLSCVSYNSPISVSLGIFYSNYFQLATLIPLESQQKSTVPPPTQLRYENTFICPFLCPQISIMTTIK